LLALESATKIENLTSIDLDSLCSRLGSTVAPGSARVVDLTAAHCDAPRRAVTPRGSGPR
jgi:hypothetical protein